MKLIRGFSFQYESELKKKEFKERLNEQRTNNIFSFSGSTIGKIRKDSFSFWYSGGFFIIAPVRIKGSYNKINKKLMVKMIAWPNPAIYFIIVVNAILILGMLFSPNTIINGKEADIIEKITFAIIWIIVWSVIVKMFFISPMFRSILILEKELKLKELK